jgi:hypothetical protein
MKYSERFDENFELYARLKDVYNFAPYDVFKGKVPQSVKKPISIKEAFYRFDTHGKLLQTKDMQLLTQLIVCKCSINFSIKEYAQDRARGWLSYLDLLDIQEEHNLPQWFVEAVEKQKSKYYPKHYSSYSCNV